jgi:drug/metabolite transporter (DMT)-like permease
MRWGRLRLRPSPCEAAKDPERARMISLYIKARDWLYRQPTLLLTLTTMMWAGNGVAGKAAVDDIAPMTLVCWRWFIACSILAVIARADVKRDWPLMRQHFLSIILMGALGFTGFNSLFYISAHYTSAVNMTILQGAIPVFVLIGAWLVYRVSASPIQIVGVVITLAGVTTIAAQGQWAMLRALTFNIGDLFLIVACVFYAGYTLALRNRPQVSPLGFFTMMAGIAFITSVPLFMIEVARGDFIWPTPDGYIILLYAALFPSLVSQLFFMRGVALVGPGRAGIFTNLVPVFGALFAVVLLGEPFHLYHIIALVLVIGGILIAETFGRRA